MRNRHRAGWRFLRFTTIVTVKAPICKVIRMSLTPFRVVWPAACLLYAVPFWLLVERIYSIRYGGLCQFVSTAPQAKSPGRRFSYALERYCELTKPVIPLATT